MKRLCSSAVVRIEPRNTKMANYFYDLPEELQALIYQLMIKSRALQFKGVHEHVLNLVFRRQLYPLNKLYSYHRAGAEAMDMYNDCNGRIVSQSDTLKRLGAPHQGQLRWPPQHAGGALFGGVRHDGPKFVHILPDLFHTKRQLMWSCDENRIEYKVSWKKEKLLHLLYQDPLPINDLRETLKNPTASGIDTDSDYEYSSAESSTDSEYSYKSESELSN